MVWGNALINVRLLSVLLTENHPLTSSSFRALKASTTKDPLLAILFSALLRPSSRPQPKSSHALGAVRRLVNSYLRQSRRGYHWRRLAPGMVRCPIPCRSLALCPQVRTRRVLKCLLHGRKIPTMALGPHTFQHTLILPPLSRHLSYTLPSPPNLHNYSHPATLRMLLMVQQVIPCTARVPPICDCLDLPP